MGRKKEFDDDFAPPEPGKECHFWMTKEDNQICTFIDKRVACKANNRSCIFWGEYVEKERIKKQRVGVSLC